MAPPLSPERSARRAALAVGCAALVVGAYAIHPHLVGVFYDDGLYAGLAVALGRGLGYVQPHLPGMPTAVHYPPLYPLLLVPLFALLPVESAALGGQILNLLLGATTAGLVTFHAMRHTLLGDPAPRWLPPAVVAASAIAIPVLTIQTVLFAEPLFGCLFAATILAADAIPRAPRPPRAAVVAGVLATLALLTRTIGIAAVGGVVLWLWLARGERRLAPWTAALPLVAAGGWGAWVAVHRGGIDPALALNYGSYGEVLRQAGVSAPGSMLDLARPLAALTLQWLPGTTAVAIAGAAAVAVGAYGLVLLARRSSVGFTLMAYVAILVVWPYPADRFLWAVLPWLGLAWAAGATALWQHRRLQVATALIAAVLSLGYAQYQARGFAGRWWQTTAQAISRNFAELLPAVRALPADAVVATDDEALVWLYTGRRAVPLHVFAYRGRATVVPEPAEHRAYLERQGVTHVLLASSSGEAAAPLRDLIVAYPTWLVPMRRWDGARWLFAVSARDHDG